MHRLHVFRNFLARNSESLYGDGTNVVKKVASNGWYLPFCANKDPFYDPQVATKSGKRENGALPAALKTLDK
jgi:hypothetical protein